MTAVEDGEPIAEGAFDTPMESVPFKRTPVAFALNAVRGECPWSVWAHHDNVGLISFAQVAAVFDLQQIGRVVTHQFYKAFKGEQAFVNKFEHRNQ